MRMQIALTVVLLLAATAAAADQVYKWVDQNGQVHFSQTPPATTGVTAQSVTVNAPPPDPQGLQNDQNLEKQIQKQNKAAQDAAERNKPDPQKEAEKKARCDDLRSHLAALQVQGRAATVDAQGNVSYLSDDQRAQQEQALQDQISKNCGG